MVSFELLEMKTIPTISIICNWQQYSKEDLLNELSNADLDQDFMNVR